MLCKKENGAHLPHTRSRNDVSKFEERHCSEAIRCVHFNSTRKCTFVFVNCLKYTLFFDENGNNVDVVGSNLQPFDN